MKEYIENRKQQVDAWFETHKEELLSDLCELLRIPSVSDPNSEVKPFGRSCRDAMDFMLSLGEKYGFSVENREYYVGAIGEKEPQYEKTIGMWNHLDVVPAGTDWLYDPYEPVIKDGYLIARGSRDNKGPAVGMLYVMRCLKELQVPMRHELRLFVGTNEEKNMDDMAYYKEQGYPYPKLSLIADSGFPVCYGEKGILEGIFDILNPGKDLLSLTGGTVSNMVPPHARAKVRFTPDRLAQMTRRAEMAERITVSSGADEILVEASGTAKHSASPQGSINAVHELAAFLAAEETISRSDRKLLSFLEEMTAGFDGEAQGIAYADELSGPTTAVGTMLSTVDGHFRLLINIRYAITANGEAMKKALASCAQAYGWTWETTHDSAPMYFDREHPAVSCLTDAFNEWFHESRKPFTMGGGTYARKLPRAFAFGIGGMALTGAEKEVEKQLLPPGHGGAHEPDEAQNLRQLFDAMKFYTCALLELDAVLE